MPYTTSHVSDTLALIPLLRYIKKKYHCRTEHRERDFRPCLFGKSIPSYISMCAFTAYKCFILIWFAYYFRFVAKWTSLSCTVEPSGKNECKKILSTLSVFESINIFPVWCVWSEKYRSRVSTAVVHTMAVKLEITLGNTVIIVRSRFTAIERPEAMFYVNSKIGTFSQDARTVARWRRNREGW